MSSNKNDTVTPEQSAELLRLTLPLMSRHGVPVTPRNYAVWFEYVRGENAELKNELQSLIDADAAFTPQLNEQLFEKYASECNVEQFLKIRNEMNDLMEDVAGSLHEVGDEAARFGGRLDGVMENVQRSNSLEDIRDLLRSLVEETRTMRRSTQLLHEHLEAKSREIALLQEELEQERRRASSDPLTGLPNRRAFTEALEKLTQDATGPEQLALLIVDIDHFKNVNDTHGHLIGDRVIRFLAQVLKQHTKGQDLAARYGGEEFVVLLPNTGLRGATVVAEQIRAAMSEAKLVRSDNKQPLGRITVSIGVAAYQPGEDPMDLVNRADQALYRSKQGGRNKVTVDMDTTGIQNRA
ncbi:MAG TPA: diguanylate cyclase [Gammaproteobacteria bacterium]|nr:diguanylate cyclase [Gammaproteobacteria bacterium]